LLTHLLRKKRVFGLDLIRCTAILFVLSAHTISFPAGKVGDLFNTGMTYAGMIGVEMFFVLSGYLIGTLLVKTHHQHTITGFKALRSFWIRRWFRTLPNYYLVIILLDLLYYPSYHSLVFSFWKNSSYLLFSQNLFSAPPADAYTIFWSLSIEEWFYLLFPLILFTTQFVFREKMRSFLATVILFITVPLLLRILFVCHDVPVDFDTGYRKITVLRLDAIGFGVLLSFLQYYKAGHLNRFRYLYFFSGIAGFLFSSYCFFAAGEANAFVKTCYFTIFSLSVMLMIPFIQELHRTGNRNYIVRLVELISVISYAIYLLHPIVILLVPVFSRELGLEPGTLPTILLIWTLTMLSSYVLYHFFERKITDLRERFDNRGATNASPV